MCYRLEEGQVKVDQRPITRRSAPKNKLSEEERVEILTVVKQDEFADLPPTQIVPKLADQGTYIASESTFYRVLREEKMQNHRGLNPERWSRAKPDEREHSGIKNTPIVPVDLKWKHAFPSI